MKARQRHRQLNVVLNGRLLGTFRSERSGAISFRYDASWLDWDYAVPMSLSLPLREQTYHGEPVIAFLENLLPDNLEIRERIAAKVRAKGTDAHHLLEKIGRDCAGALQFVTDGCDTGSGLPGSIHSDPVSTADIAASLGNLATSPLGIEAEGEFRMSIAGAQEKTAFLGTNGQWSRPRGMTPTSHIFKTRIGKFPNGTELVNSVENEFLCMRFCGAMGAEVAHVEIADFEDERALVVKRFDRQWTVDNRLLRVPHEDFCQALGYPPGMKYQSDGGPGVRDGLDLLKASDQPEKDQLEFLRAQILFWLLGATDGHAKNFSTQLKFGGGFRMAPLYDVLSIQKALDDRQIRHREFRLAMSLGRRNHCRVNKVAARHFVETARAGHVGEPLVAELIGEIAARVPAALHETREQLPAEFPWQLVDSICEGVNQQARLLFD